MRAAEAEPGSAELHVGQVRGESAALRTRSRSPLCLLVPRRRGDSVWAYASSLGGGMVAGDRTTIDIQIDEGARCFFSTQSSSKIYRNPLGRTCGQDLRARIGPKALLALAPDPIQCFAESLYEQRQVFQMEAGASLVLVDWLSAGRISRGEEWKFRRYASRNEVVRENRTILMDAIELDFESNPLTRRFQVGRFGCLGMVVLLGPLIEPFAPKILAAVAADPPLRGASLVVAASPLQEGAIIRFGGASVEQAGHALARWLGFIKELLKDDPLARKW